MSPENRPVAIYERWEKIPGLEMFWMVHDEVILLSSKEHADRAAGWLTEIMENVGDSVVNEDALPEKQVPIKADMRVCN